MVRLGKVAGCAAMLCLVMAGGCKRTAGAKASVGTSAVGEVQSFSIHGKIVSSDAAKSSVMLDADAVPGFMGAMTMQYPVKDASIASELHPGDLITAKLRVRKVGDDFEGAMLDEIVVVGQARPDYKPAVAYHVPSVGDAVPDFKLLNENGWTIHLGQFKGQVLLLTFIYTRCPLEDYCPRMNKNFAEIDRQLAGDATAYKNTHLLSVSFDPKFDTPAVLKSYGGEYVGGDGRRFAHWDFAAPSEKELGAMEQFFDVGVTPGDSGTLTHSLSTVVIGKDGKVIAWYPTNEWTAAEIVAKMKAAAAA